MPEQHDPFFIGYLAPPTRWAKLLPSIAWCAMVASLIAFGQRDPGPARWELDDPNATIGTLYERPYPMIRCRGGKVCLLVDEGKRGADKRVHGLHGTTVRIRGTTL